MIFFQHRRKKHFETELRENRKISGPVSEIPDQNPWVSMAFPTDVPLQNTAGVAASADCPGVAVPAAALAEAGCAAGGGCRSQVKARGRAEKLEQNEWIVQWNIIIYIYMYIIYIWVYIANTSMEYGYITLYNIIQN